MKHNVVAVLTCHNRKDKTINCLSKLQLSAKLSKWDIGLNFAVCDDNCTDGTSEAIQELFPHAMITHGDGDLYWARGMAAAMIEAELLSPDFYLMVNDDVDFYTNTFDILFDSLYAAGNDMYAIVGSTCDKNGVHTYGGIRWNRKLFHEEQWRVIPNGEIQLCELTNWNCFLISSKLYRKIGPIDSYYEHSAADYDYSNRLSRTGNKIYVAKEYVGVCEKNSIKNTWRDTSLPFQKRWTLLHKKTGIPVKSNWYYSRKYYGIWALFHFIKPYLGLFKSVCRRK